jgi:hypothetical protein
MGKDGSAMYELPLDPSWVESALPPWVRYSFDRRSRKEITLPVFHGLRGDAAP